MAASTIETGMDLYSAWEDMRYTVLVYDLVQKILGPDECPLITTQRLKTLLLAEVKGCDIKNVTSENIQKIVKAAYKDLCVNMGSSNRV